MKKRLLALFLALFLWTSLLPGALATPGIIIPPPKSALNEEVSPADAATDEKSGDDADLIPDGETAPDPIPYAQETPTPTPPPSTEGNGDFVFDAHGDLLKYTGPGGDVVVPDGVTMLHAWSFDGCTTLTSVTLPASVTTVDSYAFKGCINLTSITMGSACGLYNYALQDCVSLKEVTFGPGHMTSGSITNETFRDCAKLERVIIQQDNDAFFSQDGIVYMKENTLKYGSPVRIRFAPQNLQGTVTLPDTLPQVWDHDISFRPGITSLDTGDGLTQIFHNLTYGCDGLEHLFIGRSVSYIEDPAFFCNCENLTAIDVDEDNATFASQDGILYNKAKTQILCVPPALKGTVTLPDGVTTIGAEQFKNRTGLVKLTLGRGITQIADTAFVGCSGLKTVVIPDGLTYSPGKAIPAGVTLVDQNGASLYGFTIQEGTLRAYTGPGGHVTVPEGVTTIAAEAFKNCANVTKVSLPSTVTAIYAGAFEGCAALTDIALPERLTFIGNNAFSGCAKLTRIDLPHSLASLGSGVFSGTGIASLVIPEGVTSCGLIRGDALRELTLPSTLESRPALSCPALRKLTLPKDCWTFKGISRANFMSFISGCPMLNTVVNCPNEFVDELIQPNVALQNNWKDPQSTITPQSDRITQLSNQITKSDEPMSDYDKAKAISQWVVSHIKYDDDYYYEGLKDYSDVPFAPEEILDKGQAVCAGISRLTQALLVAQDIPCLYVQGEAGGPHAWNLALLNGEYLWLDNTWGMNYFGIGVYAISTAHQADGAAFFNRAEGPGSLVSSGRQASETVLPAVSGTAHPSTREVLVDGKRVSFQCYCLKNAAGDDTNYIKLRDLAGILNGSSAQFDVGWDGKNVTITIGQSYTPNGSEQQTPFSGQRSYSKASAVTLIDAQPTTLAAFVLNDDAGGGYTYYQLRELGKALGFNVGWSAEQGIFVESNKPYGSKN